MIHGLLLVNKPKDISSHGAVARIRRYFQTKKVGHFGTLDPLAQGLLLVGIGRVTKLADFYIKKNKAYTGLIRFGFATSTFDKEGEPLSPARKIDLHTIELDPVIEQFIGKIDQTPPIYSAKKFKGKPLYKYARENKEIALKPTKVNIFFFEKSIVGPDLLRFHTKTSSGTYIRSLAHDLGQVIGCGAHLEALKRERIADYQLKDALDLEQLEQAAADNNLHNCVLPIESLLPELTKIIVNDLTSSSVLNGMSIEMEQILKIIPAESESRFRIFSEEGQFLAIARKNLSDQTFQPYIVFSS